MLKLDLLKVQN